MIVVGGLAVCLCWAYVTLYHRARRCDPGACADRPILFQVLDFLLGDLLGDLTGELLPSLSREEQDLYTRLARVRSGDLCGAAALACELRGLSYGTVRMVVSLARALRGDTAVHAGVGDVVGDEEDHDDVGRAVDLVRFLADCLDRVGGDEPVSAKGVMT